jgi:hypothetical protein
VDDLFRVDSKQNNSNGNKTPSILEIEVPKLKRLDGKNEEKVAGEVPTLNDICLGSDQIQK